jgi:deoxyribodipyrimidine photo-lyase
MWFASIWIFTLRLPWALGAAFFMRHLLDGDPASNTLSWRWVAGLHTKGKHYVARAENIARYTEGRFDPRGQLDETPEPLEEAASHPSVSLSPVPAMPPGEISLLLHDDDLAVAGFEHAQQVAFVSTAEGADGVTEFAAGAVADAQARLGRGVIIKPGEVAAWLAAQSLPVVSPFAPLGRNADLLRDLRVTQIRRDWDSKFWPHATRGFFQMKQRLPELL